MDIFGETIMCDFQWVGEIVMHMPNQNDLQVEDTSVRAIKYKDSGNGFLKFLITITVVTIAIVLSVIFGEAFVSMFVSKDTLTTNQVEYLEQETQWIAGSLREQRESLLAMDIKLIDQNIKQEERFSDLEARVEKLEAELIRLQEVGQVKSHRVRTGETLWSITVQHYGNGAYVNALARYNNITNPRVIISGTTLKIPPASALR